MAEENVSYSRLVFRRAWRNTWALLKDTTLDAIVGFPSLLIGAALFFLFYGWDEMTKEVATFLAFVIAPAGIFFIFAFLWNLCLASDELVYEAIKGLQTTAPAQVAAVPVAKSLPKPVNWAIWKKRERFTVSQFAAILAKNDPMSAAEPNEQASYKELILEAIADKKLAYIPSYFGAPSRDNEFTAGDNTEIKRADAIAWAERSNFPVEHVKA